MSSDLVFSPLQVAPPVTVHTPVNIPPVTVHSPANNPPPAALIVPDPAPVIIQLPIVAAPLVPPPPLAELDMAIARARDLEPCFFEGNPSEDPEAFLNHYTRWATFRDLSAQLQIPAFPLLLRGSALMWFEHLPDEKKNSIETIKQSFKERFLPGELDKCKAACELWSSHQDRDESVENYICRQRKRAATAGLAENDQQLRFAVINGLRPSIKLHVLQNNHETLDEIVKHGKISEQAQIGETNQLETLIKGVNDRLDKLSIMECNIFDRNTKEEDRSFESRKGSRKDNSNEEKDSSSRHYDRSRSRSAYRSRSSTPDRRVRFEQSPTRYHQRNAYKTRPSFGSKCFRCSNSHQNKPCYALNLQCRFCGKVGHVIKACLKKKRQQSANTQ